VGPGLLGGSVHLAVRAAGLGCHRVAVGRNPQRLQLALDADAADEVTTDFATALDGADLVVVCTTIGSFPAIFERMAPHLPGGCVVTDVGSTKQVVVGQARRLLGRSTQFVGAHPMAGGEKTGVQYARADLFDRATCIVTPTQSSPRSAVARVEAFWRTLGCRVIRMTPAAHDRAVATVSHLPHAAAACLMRLADRSGHLDLAGAGLLDMTRIASGDPDLWVDIFATNRRSVVASIDRFVRELTALRDAIDGDRRRRVRRLLDEPRQARDAWIDRRYQRDEVEP